MTVSKPLSVVLQLIALVLIVMAGYKLQQGHTEALGMAAFAVLVLVLSRKKKA